MNNASMSIKITCINSFLNLLYLVKSSEFNSEENMPSYIEWFAKKSRISCWCGVLYIWTYIPRKSVSFLYWIGSIPSSICVITERFLAYVTKEACKLHLVSRAVIFFSYLHIQKAKQVRRITLSNVIFLSKNEKLSVCFGF